MKRTIIAILLLTISAATAQVSAQKLPKPGDVLQAMHCANDYFLQKYPDPTIPTFVKKERPSNLWTRGVYFEGLMALNSIDLKEENRDYVICWARFHKFSPRNGVYTRDADDYCCCQTYLDMNVQYNIYPLSEEREAALTPTILCMNNLLHPAPESLTPATKARYGVNSFHDWTWIDAIQMGLPVLTKLPVTLAIINGDESVDLSYAEHGYHMYLWTRDSLAGGLYNKDEHLWWRDRDFVPPYAEPNGKNCYWSRGNGWVYAALVRAMESALLYKSQFGNIPEEFHFNDYKADFLEMTEALLKCQRSDTFWNVSLHDSSNFGGPELTGTALFIYGMAWGVNNDILPKEKFEPIIAKTWKKMVKKCLRKDGFLHFVQGTGKEPKDSQPVGRNIEPDFDDYGLGCFLLAGCEVYNLCK